MSLLELRNRLSKNKPDFVRHDFHKKRLRKRWAKPQGLHAKMRLRKSGHPRPISTGYGLPKDVRHLSREGLNVKRILNEADLKNVDKEKEGIIIAKNVGMKNKVLLLKKAKEMGVKVLNLNADEYIKKKEEGIKKRMEERKGKKKGREKKKEEAKDKKKEEKLEEKLIEEEGKELEKKEMDKLLTKRET